MSRLSVIVPTLDEGERIAATLRYLQAPRGRGCEIILVDGGSRDETVARARPLVDRVLVAPRGRALQMNAGGRIARGDVLLFLHADSTPPAHFDRLIATRIGNQARAWGRFDVVIEGRSRAFPLISAFMNVRSRWSGIATGDQGIFVTRVLFDEAGGFPPLALMEDVALSRLLNQRQRPICLKETIATSGRRWEHHGVLRTILLMWRLRYAYWRGADPNELALRYGRGH